MVENSAYTGRLAKYMRDSLYWNTGKERAVGFPFESAFRFVECIYYDLV